MDAGILMWQCLEEAKNLLSACPFSLYIIDIIDYSLFDSKKLCL